MPRLRSLRSCQQVRGPEAKTAQAAAQPFGPAVLEVLRQTWARWKNVLVIVSRRL
jgi:hypothetical protein